MGSSLLLELCARAMDDFLVGIMWVRDLLRIGWYAAWNSGPACAPCLAPGWRLR